jgi:hypothetical protein
LCWLDNFVEKETSMKTSRIVTTVLLGTLLAAFNAFAGNKTELHLKEPITVQGQTIPAGDYTLRWDRNDGPETEVKIIRGNKVMATVHAKWVTLQNKPADDALVVSHDDGVRRLQQVRFEGKAQALEMEQETFANKSDDPSHAKAGAP